MATGAAVVGGAVAAVVATGAGLVVGGAVAGGAVVGAAVGAVVSAGAGGAVEVEPPRAPSPPSLSKFLSLSLPTLLSSEQAARTERLSAVRTRAMRRRRIT